jgi:hypothetical protein
VSEAPLLTAVLPQLAERIETALREQRLPRVADQVATLRITGPCTCGQPFCGSFQTLKTPLKRWFMRGRQIDVQDGGPGEIVIDLVRGEIAYVEVLYLDDVRDTVARLASR